VSDVGDAILQNELLDFVFVPHYNIYLLMCCLLNDAVLIQNVHRRLIERQCKRTGSTWNNNNNVALSVKHCKICICLYEQSSKTGNIRINITSRRVRVTTVVVEK